MLNKPKTIIGTNTFIGQMREFGYTPKDRDISWTDLHAVEADMARKTCQMSSSARQVAKNLLAVKATGKQITSIHIIDDEAKEEIPHGFCQEIGCTGQNEKCPNDPDCTLLRKATDAI
jgi:pyruvate/2-oxoglutarate dehydrogenase complex dihydrolipoamide acyltransferase (E2) component